MPIKVEPFTIDIPGEKVADLRRRLRSVNWAPDFGNADWRYGVERNWLQDLTHYWAESFDWRAQEAEMNRFPHFKADIDGVPIHFIHIRSGAPDAVPIILSHGWPWTFWDWKDVIEPLAFPERFGGSSEDAFDVVVPSLPGYVFSSPLRSTGIGAREIAALWKKLMCDVLGYECFAAAGGDWGGIVTSELGHCFPDIVTAISLFTPSALGVNRFAIEPEDFGPDEEWAAQRWIVGRELVKSHVAVHTHDPQTLAYALCDSPVGTASWIWERRRSWSDCDGDLVALHGRDFLCATASLYWLTDTAGTALRIYAEQLRNPWKPVNDRPLTVSVPTSLAVPPKDVAMMPRAIIEQRLNLQRYTILERGGHFVPSEQPDSVVGEIRAFFRTQR